MRVEYNGEAHDFPDNWSDEEVAAALSNYKPSPELASMRAITGPALARQGTAPTAMPLAPMLKRAVPSVAAGVASMAFPPLRSAMLPRLAGAGTSILRTLAGAGAGAATAPIAGTDPWHEAKLQGAMGLGGEMLQGGLTGAGRALVEDAYRVPGAVLENFPAVLKSIHEERIPVGTRGGREGTNEAVGRMRSSARDTRSMLRGIGQPGLPPRTVQPEFVPIPQGPQMEAVRNILPPRLEPVPPRMPGFLPIQNVASAFSRSAEARASLAGMAEKYGVDAGELVDLATRKRDLDADLRIFKHGIEPDDLAAVKELAPALGRERGMLQSTAETTARREGGREAVRERNREAMGAHREQVSAERSGVRDRNRVKVREHSRLAKGARAENARRAADAAAANAEAIAARGGVRIDPKAALKPLDDLIRSLDKLEGGASQAAAAREIREDFVAKNGKLWEPLEAKGKKGGFGKLGSAVLNKAAKPGAPPLALNEQARAQVYAALEEGVRKEMERVIPGIREMEKVTQGRMGLSRALRSAELAPKPSIPYQLFPPRFLLGDRRARSKAGFALDSPMQRILSRGGARAAALGLDEMTLEDELETP